MNKPLEDALLQIIQSTTTSMTTAVDFLSAQIPDVIYQLLLWNTIYYSLQCVCGVAIGIFTIKWTYQIFAIGRTTKTTASALQSFVGSYNHRGEFEEFGPSIILVAVGLPVMALISGAFTNITWLQILIAPKIWLIEYAAHLVK